jgi:hypothetical protein
MLFSPSCFYLKIDSRYISLKSEDNEISIIQKKKKRIDITLVMSLDLCKIKLFVFFFFSYFRSMVRQTLFLLAVLFCLHSKAQMAKNIVDINGCPNKTISLSIHVVLDTNGMALTTPAAVQISVDQMNVAFDPMCLQFKICKYDTVYESLYNLKTGQSYIEELTTKYNVHNTINVYYSNTVTPLWGSLDGSYGLAASANDPTRMSDTLLRDFMILNYSDITAITHEMGHFFGLYDTFDTQFGAEFANGTNCATTGDLMCDTEADPNNSSDGNCHIVNRNLTDSNGDFYTPPICNHMGRYSTGCAKSFTPEQFNRMLMILKTKRNYLW